MRVSYDCRVGIGTESSLEKKVLILGAGFTGERVARRMAARGATVVRTRTQGGDIALAWPLTGEMAEALRRLPGQDWLVLHSIPLVRQVDAAGAVTLQEGSAEILACLAGKVSRMVYISTTGVYGEAKTVDETTPVQARTPREMLRVQAETAVCGGDWSACVLRPAAIYGPGRGAHASIRQGRWRLGAEGENYVLRIHVDDLAAHAEAALLHDVTGAWPVADEEPCTSMAITRYCCELYGLPLPAQVEPGLLDETRRADRRVDGRAIRARLGISLQYPNYRVGIAACIAAEEQAAEEEKRSATAMHPTKASTF